MTSRGRALGDQRLGVSQEHPDRSHTLAVVGTKRKTPNELNGMIEHVRYEMTRAIDFVVVGNAWCESLQEPIRTFTQQSILEAGLIHFRCLIEFLGDQPTSDQVMARDYLPDWDWRIGENLRQVAQLHGRLAHLGLARCAVERTEVGYSWQKWLSEQAPAVLRGTRNFLLDLREASPDRYALFVRPRADPVAIDLVALLDQLVGPR